MSAHALSPPLAISTPIFGGALLSAGKKQSKSHSLSPPSQSVRFSLNTKLIEVQHLSEMTDTQINNAYYSEKDYASITAEISATIMATIKANLLMETIDTERQTMRGLEHCRAKCILDQYQDERKRHVALVVGAQNTGLSPDDIAHISSKVSRKAVRNALQLGSMDGAEVNYMYS